MANATSHVTVRLRKPLERSIARGHPWLWRDAVEPFRAEAGAVATITDTRGRFLARGLVDGDAIAVRLFSTRDEVMGPALLEGRVRRALELRERIMTPDTDAWRLLHGEGDRMPGFVCDLYGSIAVLALDGAGAEAWREVMIDVLRAVLPARGVEALLVRSGRGETRRVEAAWGKVPVQAVTVREHGMVLHADLARGQKTGLFLDQRISRLRVRSLARSMRVLNLYGYTGGFSVAAGLGGARAVTTVDVAAPALDLARESWRANHLDPTRHDIASTDVMSFVGERMRAGARYDLVIADPPSFAPREELVEGALRSYRALHAACLALLAPGGWYLAGSCSSHVTREAFTKTVCEGAQRARRVLQWVDRWGAPADHPVLAAFGEGEYLKNVLARAIE